MNYKDSLLVIQLIKHAKHKLTDLSNAAVNHLSDLRQA